jgi:hypothetical protein
MNSLDVVLKPYANAELEPQRRDHLFGLCQRAGSIGMLLLSQPAEWVFDWKYKPKGRNRDEADQSTRSSRKPMVVFPALIRLTDNSAKQLERPKVVLEHAIRRRAGQQDNERGGPKLNEKAPVLV